MSRSKLTRPVKAVERSPLAEARASALRAYLARRNGGLWLADDAYRNLRWATGLTRGEVQRAIDLLAAQGEIVIEASGGCLVVRLAEQVAMGGA
jgi:hypothetical protein